MIAVAEAQSVLMICIIVFTVAGFVLGLVVGRES